MNIVTNMTSFRIQRRVFLESLKPIVEKILRSLEIILVAMAIDIFRKIPKPQHGLVEELLGLHVLFIKARQSSMMVEAEDLYPFSIQAINLMQQMDTTIKHPSIGLSLIGFT